jgi:hypothetical protein
MAKKKAKATKKKSLKVHGTFSELLNVAFTPPKKK